MKLRNIAFAGLLALPGAAQALTPSEIFDRVSPSIWAVYGVDQNQTMFHYGSAVVIGPQKVVTNCHVVEKTNTVLIRRENVIYEAKRAESDSKRDLCLLSVANFSAAAVEIAPIAELKVGQRVYAIGNPVGLTATLSEGLISGLRGEHGIQTSAPISPGSSGGGLFDEQGRLVGITTLSVNDSKRRAQNLNFAMPAEWISEVIERAKERLARLKSEKTAARAAGRAVEGMPPVGASWKYRFEDRRYDHVRTFTVRVTEVDGRDVHESIDVEGGAKRVSTIDAKEVLFEPRRLAGSDAAMELAPYFYSSEADEQRAREERPGGYPGNSEWQISKPEIQPDVAVVPAGSYEAIRVKVTGNLPQYIVGGSAASAASIVTSRFEYTAWYAPEIHRYVKVQHKTWNPFNSIIGDEVVVLLDYEAP